jgi:hypothetical protein
VRPSKANTVDLASFTAQYNFNNSISSNPNLAVSNSASFDGKNFPIASNAVNLGLNTSNQMDDLQFGGSSSMYAN